MQRRQALDHAAEKIGGGSLAVFGISAVPDSDLVDLDILDCLGLELDNLFEFFDDEHLCRGVRIVSAGGDDLVEALAFRLQDGEITFCFRFELEINRIGLTFCLAAEFFGFRFRTDDSLFLFDFGLDDVFRFLTFHFHLGAGDLSGSFSLKISLFDLGFRYALRNFSQTERFRFLRDSRGVGFCNFNRGKVFAFDCAGVRLFHGNTAVAVGICFTGLRLRIGKTDGNTPFLVGICFTGLRFCIGLLDGDAPFLVGVRFTGLRLRFGEGDGDSLGFARFGFTDSALPFLFCNIDTRLVDRFRSGALSDGVNVSALVCDVGDIDVQELKTELVELFRDVLFNVAEEGFAVGVDLFDRHGGDHQTELTEDNVFCEIRNLLLRNSEQTVCRVAHQGVVCAHADREDRRHVDSDVLHAESVGQIDFNLQRTQRKESVILNHRPDERRAAVDTPCRLVALRLTENDEHLIRRTLFIARRNADQDDEEDEKQKNRDEDAPRQETAGRCKNQIHGYNSPFLFFRYI